MSEFDVMAEFRAALTNSENPDPREVAAEVVAAVPEEELRLALLQALFRLAPTVAGNQRRAAMAHLPSSPPAPGRDRWAGAGAIYKGILKERVQTPSGYKLMGDCTVDDMRAAADYRRGHAQAVLVAANRFDRIADLLVERSVSTVAELAESDLDEVAA